MELMTSRVLLRRTVLINPKIVVSLRLLGLLSIHNKNETIDNFSLFSAKQFTFVIVNFGHIYSININIYLYPYESTRDYYMFAVRKLLYVLNYFQYMLVWGRN